MDSREDDEGNMCVGCVYIKKKMRGKVGRNECWMIFPRRRVTIA